MDAAHPDQAAHQTPSTQDIPTATSEPPSPPSTTLSFPIHTTPPAPTGTDSNHPTGPSPPALTSANLALLELQAQNAALTEENHTLRTQTPTLTPTPLPPLLSKLLTSASTTTASLRKELASANADLRDAKRTISRLRKSDRAKDRQGQLFLRLKAQMGAHECAPAPPPVPSSVVKKAKVEMEMELREALASAKRRVEELEWVGGTLLRALEEEDSDEEDGEDGGEEEEEEEEGEEGRRGRMGVAEAQLVFRRVVEDEGGREMREGWGELLKRGL